jgi:hypothetical protein
MSQDQMNEWMPGVAQSSTLQQMDNLIESLQLAREAYDAAKKASAQKYHELEEIEKEVMNTLKANGRTRYEAEGIAQIRIQTKEVYATPKTPDEKRALFTYIKDKYGNDTLTSMISINHNTLNSWANKESEANPSVQIPGLDQPTSVETLYFTTKK